MNINRSCTVHTLDLGRRPKHKVAGRSDRVPETLLAHQPDERMQSQTQPGTGFVYPAWSYAAVFFVTKARAALS